MFRGHEAARIDDKGRLKVPNVFRSLLESKYGREVFLTSLSGEYVRLYPMPVWIEVEEKLAILIVTHPHGFVSWKSREFLRQLAELDPGLVLLAVRLRDTKRRSAGDVDVLGNQIPRVWNRPVLTSSHAMRT